MEKTKSSVVAIAPELKPAYRAWCSLLVQGWIKDVTWGRLLGRAEVDGLPMDQMPTTLDGFYPYKGRIRPMIANNFPELSKKLFDADSDEDRGLVLLWLMKTPFARVQTVPEDSPFATVRKQARTLDQQLIAGDRVFLAKRASHQAGTHVSGHRKAPRVRV